MKPGDAAVTGNERATEVAKAFLTGASFLPKGSAKLSARAVPVATAPPRSSSTRSGAARTSDAEEGARGASAGRGIVLTSLANPDGPLRHTQSSGQGVVATPSGWSPLRWKPTNYATEHGYFP